MKYYYQLADTVPGRWREVEKPKNTDEDWFVAELVVGDLKPLITCGDLKTPHKTCAYLAKADDWNVRHNKDGKLAPILVTKYALEIGDPKPEPVTTTS